MAAKRTTSSSVALTKWDEKLATLAQQATDTEKGVGAGNMLTMQGGILQYKGAEIPENRIQAVILDSILHNTYYDTGFDPGNPSPPACYAFAREEDGMAPHEQAADPQNETCRGCPQNEWGTADRGRGKACGNKRRLALISEGDIDDIANAEIAFMHIPVTSVRAWAGYVRQLESTLRRPPLAVITEISVEKDPQTQFKVHFKMVSTIDAGEIIGQLLEKSEQAKTEIEFPYIRIENPQATAPARGARRAAVAGRKTLPSRRPAPPQRSTAVPVAPNRKSKF